MAAEAPRPTVQDVNLETHALIDVDGMEEILPESLINAPTDGNRATLRVVPRADWVAWKAADAATKELKKQFRAAPQVGGYRLVAVWKPL